MEHDNEFDPIVRYETFFKEFTTDGKIKYREMIEKMPMQNTRSLEINFDDLWNFDPELARQTLQSPIKCINAAAQAIKNVMVIEAEDYAEYNFHARFVNLPEDHRIHLRKIRADHIGKLISVNGILTRASEVKPQLTVGIFECRVCNERMSIIQGDYYTKPYQCANSECNRKGPFNFIAQESIFIDWQKIRLQEKPEELPAGQLPRSLDAYLKEDLVDTVRPGNRITAVGILYSAQDMGQRGSLKTFHVFLEVNSLDTSEIDTERLEITPKEEKRIKELAKDEWIHRKIIHSIAPTIYGFENVKEAIATQLFGGVAKPQKDGTTFRGESHVLLVGDPGTGKSMILQYVSKIAPRGLYTSGKGATAVGLCISGDSNILLLDGIQPISQIVENEFDLGNIEQYNEKIEYKKISNDLQVFHVNGLKLKAQEISKVWRIKSPEKMIKIITRTGRELKLTHETKILSIDRNSGLIWKQSKELKLKDRVAISRTFPIKFIKPVFSRQKIGFAHTEKKYIDSIQLKHEIYKEKDEFLKNISQSDIFWDEIKEIKEFIQTDPYVYDLTVPNSHNFVANGFIVHNTAAVLRDKETGDFALEAGALVLADRGIACLDEFDKMDPSDRVAIHEAMEQRTISIAKAGIVATLNARTSILAAANPTFGRYDEYKNVSDNIKRLPVTILSRFDLIFILKDRPEAEKDSQMADVIIQSITEEVEPPIEVSLLRKYIHYARRTCFPNLSEDASVRLKSFYIEKRGAGEKQDSPVPITARQLGALIRLAQAHARMALRNEVTIEDAEAAIRLLEYSLRQVGTDQETGMSDIDIIYTGQSKTQRDRLETLHDIIRDMVRQKGEAISIEEILQEGERNNLQRSFMERAIEQLIARGLIYQPEAGKIRPVD